MSQISVGCLRGRLLFCGVALGLFLTLGIVEQARAALPPIDLNQTDVTVLRTGGVNPLITQIWELNLNTFPRTPLLSFSFAFGTEETPEDGQILDSATFFVQDLNQLKVSVLFTVDAFGVSWLPGLEGEVVIPFHDLDHEALPFPSLQPVMGIETSHSVTVQIPDVYYPEPIQFVFQLFDYPNGYNSMGVVTPPELFLVPEPTTIALGGLALFTFWISRRISRSTSRARPKP